MKMLKLKLSVLFAIITQIIVAQEYFPKNTGVKTTEHSSIAFTNATIHVSPNEVLKNATLWIVDEKIKAVGKNVKLPTHVTTVDLTGKSIYPSFVDVYSDYGIKKSPSQGRRRFGGSPQYDASRKGYYWNDHIRPDIKAITDFKYDNKVATELLEAGFGILNTHKHDGIVRGTGMLVALNQQGTAADQILDATSGQYLSFQKSSASSQSYPTSLMGSIALLKQMYLDAQWYEQGKSKTKDLALEALIANKNEVQIFEAGNWLNDLRADKIGDTHNIQYVLLGGGNEYQRIDAIKKTNATFILPLKFPKAYDLTNPLHADKVSLKDLKHWNLAPSNPKILKENNITFALTPYGLSSISEFKKALAKAISYGLDKKTALAALTTVPAQILGKTGSIGTLNQGKLANFTITSGDIFDKEVTIYEHWIQGNKNSFKALNLTDIRGNYTLAFNGEKFNLNIGGKLERPKATLKRDTVEIKSNFSFKDHWLTLSYKEKNAKKHTRLVGRINTPKSSFNGKLVNTKGDTTPFSATYNGPATEDKKKDFKKGGKDKGGKGRRNGGKDKKDSKKPELMPLSYPFGAYGMASIPKQEDLLIKNATVWTNEKEGILKNTDVLIRDGKIAKIGTNLRGGKAKVIDGTGKYLTAGIIDEHSHIATSSVNESGHNSTAEVSIQDVVNSEDVNIYRNLAGGVTAIQILHGSANPIGGQSALIKLKWGETPDNLLIPNAPKFIKFALGENVKQSNWGDAQNIRFPQTRMGVEQVYIDYFTRAKAYEKRKTSGQPYRKDVELETLLEILNKERFISCHSYVQSEVNMLMKVADKFGFTLNTFTHILEGYKVADKMKKHGAGGSTFSDWWAYKYEVNDAIPHNGAIMHNMGITVAFNSDDAEMSRRLNQEAAKAVKYGNVSEEDAWKFVTLNPAKLLHLDNRMGSIKIGKDADVVLWNAHPMSVYAKAEKTIVDGTIYFDLEKDTALRQQVKKERSTLINMMIDEKNGGGETQSPKRWRRPHIHCDFEGNYQH